MTRTSPMVPMTPIQAAHAIAACERIETGLRAAADRAQRAIEEAQAELQKMLDAINADRAARGVAPLDVTLPPLHKS
jgi:hypothetical protein